MCKDTARSQNLNYEVTLKEAQKLLIQKDFGTVAELTGASLQQDGSLEAVFLGRRFNVSSEGNVSLAGSDEPPNLTTKILLLHYLIHAEGAPAAGKVISFKELPGGAIYIQPFTNRAINPLVSIFGPKPEELLAAAGKLGGEKAALGDVSVTVKVFPKVPVTLVLWAGDDEFPASGNILFDASAPHYLPTEDYAVLAQFLVQTLKTLK